MDIDLIKEYYNSCNPTNIEYAVQFKLENGEINEVYYRKLINAREDAFISELESNEKFDLDVKKRLKSEVKNCSFLQAHIVKLFESVCRWQNAISKNDNRLAGAVSNRINLEIYEIEQIFSNIDYQKFFIRKFLNEGKYAEAILIRNFCIDLLEVIISHFNQWYNIDLMSSPLNKLFIDHLSILEKIVNVDEIKLIQNQNQILLRKSNESEIKEIPEEEKNIIFSLVDNDGEIIDYQKSVNDEIKTFIQAFKITNSININYNKKKYLIYSAGIAYLFSNKIRKVKVDDELVELDTRKYFDVFVEEYEKGIKYFKEKYQVSKDVLYGSNSKTIVNDIHNAYYNKLYFNSKKGWVSIKNSNPIITNFNDIKKYGFLSGVLSEADEFIESYPTIFKGFHKCTKDKKESQESQNQNVENDFLKSTIEDYLEPIKKYFKDKDYNLLLDELESYFKTGAFTKSNEIIKIVNKPNMKIIGWNLKELYHASFNDNRTMDIDYLKFGKQRISIFKDVSFDENQITKSNLYKYYHSRP